MFQSVIKLLTRIRINNNLKTINEMTEKKNNVKDVIFFPPSGNDVLSQWS